MAMSVTRAAVISTTNMTGFRIRSRGSSLRKASGMAARRSAGSKTPRGLGRLAGRLAAAERHEALEAARAAGQVDAEMRCQSWCEGHSGVLEELLDDRPEGEGREEGQGADDDDHADDAGR